MRLKLVVPILGVVAACGAGVAVAAHPQVDPAQVPTGFLTAHSTVNNIPAASIERALRSGKADVFIEHARLTPNQETGYHTHPGPAFVVVQRGSVRLDEASADGCRRRGYGQGRGFVDGAGRRAHRLVAGASGADLYEVYLLPRRTGPHQNAASPGACAS
jgi:hypothetical protein